MRILSDSIEAFLKSLIDDESSQVDIKRNELATHFNCAPSQINYVIATRFTPERGYVTHSKRGGGGYIRIMRLIPEDDDVYNMLSEKIGNEINVESAWLLIKQLRELGKINQREAQLMMAATSHCAISLPLRMKDALRASILKIMVASLSTENEGREK